jgi:hypothetical protein
MIMRKTQRGYLEGSLRELRFRRFVATSSVVAFVVSIVGGIEGMLIVFFRG